MLENMFCLPIFYTLEKKFPSSAHHIVSRIPNSVFSQIVYRFSQSDCFENRQQTIKWTNLFSDLFISSQNYLNKTIWLVDKLMRSQISWFGFSIWWKLFWKDNDTYLILKWKKSGNTFGFKYPLWIFAKESFDDVNAF